MVGIPYCSRIFDRQISSAARPCRRVRKAHRNGKSVENERPDCTSGTFSLSFCSPSALECERQVLISVFFRADTLETRRLVTPALFVPPKGRSYRHLLLRLVFF